MIVGVKQLGKMKTYKGQCITTRFIILFIPLIPVESLFKVANGSNISLGRNTKSILKTYLSWILLLVGLVGILTSNFSHAFPVVPPVWSLVGGIVCLGLSFYFFFRFQQSTSSENELRDLFQLAIGINALPTYFSYNAAYDFQLQLKRNLKDTYQIKNWRDAMEDHTYTDRAVPLLFSIVAFQQRMMPTTKTQQMYEQLKVAFETMIKNNQPYA